jgi:hypothetical protein
MREISAGPVSVITVTEAVSGVMFTGSASAGLASAKSAEKAKCLVMGSPAESEQTR